MSKFDIVKPESFRRPGRLVNKVFLHCSASDRPEHDNPRVIEEWHRARLFREIGYHYYVDKKGQIWQGRSIELVPASQEGHNAGSIGICAGGEESFTDEQLAAVRSLCMAINQSYAGRISFHGHCEVSSKKCPVFDYKLLLELDDKGKMPLGG